MRAIIVTDFDGHLRKLMWLTEFNDGVSTGIYDTKQDPHATYHADGTFHVRFTKGEHRLKFAEEKKVPLNQIEPKEQLLGTNFVYNDDVMARQPQFTLDFSADALMVLGQSVFRDVGYLALNIYVIHRSHEAKFIMQTYSSYEDKSYSLVALNVFKLHLFADHEVGVIIYKRRAHRLC